MDFDSSIERAKTNKVTSLVFTLKPIYFFFAERDGCRSIPGSEFADGKPFCFYNATPGLQIHRKKINM